MPAKRTVTNGAATVMLPLSTPAQAKAFPLMVGEAAVVAICNLAGIIVQASQDHRDGMSQENRNRADTVLLNGLERADRVLEWLDKQIFGGEAQRP